LINLRFIVMKHNEHEIPRLRGFAQRLGVDVLTLRTLYPHDDGSCCATKADGSEFVPENPAYQRFDYDTETRSRVRRTHNPCKALWNNPVIHWDGTVCPCTFDAHDRHALGDITKEAFGDIWFGASYRELRRQFRGDYQRISLCSECSNAFEGGTVGGDIVEAHFFDR
jgi:radical SAM protein with 4Fe4S-binding SPASM domain